MSTPRLSIVVTVVDGGETLRRCLSALGSQIDSPTLEVIVPFDSSIQYVRGLVEAFPGFEALFVGMLETEWPLESYAGQHELFDRRRALGLAAATGEIVCILEDRGIPDPDWASTVDRLHAQRYSVIGGAVECDVNRILNWAVYFCDFSRYQLPLAAGPREYLTDINISFKREALEKTRKLWEDRYHETTVNWALRRHGEELFLFPDMVVRQRRENLRPLSVLQERFAWGRLFACTRISGCTPLQRVVYLLLSPMLPLILFLRIGWAQVSKRVRFTKFLRAAPLVLLLLSAWSLGELWGYVTGRG